MDHIVVRLTPYSILKLWTPKGPGDEVCFQADATNGGWAFLVVSFVIAPMTFEPLALFAAAVVAVMFVRARPPRDESRARPGPFRIDHIPRSRPG